MAVATEAEAVVRGFYDALNARDFAAVAGFIDPACEWTSVASGARERGPAPILKGLLDFVEAFPDLRIDVLDVVARGSTVVVEWRTAGTHLGALRGHDASRRRLSRRGCAVLEVEGGVIVRARDYYDRQTLAEQLKL
jgi:steroid delta-isomerase-like uncharacterized protein